MKPIHQDETQNRKHAGKWLVGLTGGIGSGKTTVAECFQDRGIVVIDSDEIAHRITAPGGAAMAAIASAFGSQVVAADGSLDRERMRELVFEDPQQRKRLESILHPMIRQISDDAVLAATSPYVMLAIPLLIESEQARNRVNCIVVVDCPEAQQIERVMKRSGLTEARVQSIIAAQASREQRLAFADAVIENHSTLQALEAQIDALHQRFLSEAAAAFGACASDGGQSPA